VNTPSITLSGHVAAAPHLRLAGGAPVTSFRVGATPRRHDKATDTWVDDETLWFTVTAWRALAEHCASSLTKGDKVLVTGKLTQSSWTGDDGAVRTGHEVEAVSVGIDLSRHSAVSVRPKPAQREQGDPVPAGPDGSDDGEWVSTGAIDDDTGEVRMERAVPVQDAEEREPAGV
jgi:single-strand DNA-binding protein